MEDIYTWLFDHYALPRMKELDSRHREAAGVCAGRLALNQENTLHFTDFTDTMRLHWGIEAFALGVRFGLGLNGPREQDMDLSWLVQTVPEACPPAGDGSRAPAPGRRVTFCSRKK